jgi:hypothetical protein
MYRENAKDQMNNQATDETETRHWRRVLWLTALRVATIVIILLATATSYRIAKTPKVVKPTGCHESAQVITLGLGGTEHECPTGARAETKQVKVDGEDVVLVQCKCLTPSFESVIHHDGPLLDSDGTKCWVWQPLTQPEGAVMATNVQTCTSRLGP